jgi:hypothetical protein
VCSQFTGAAAVYLGDHQSDFIGGHVQRAVSHAGAVGRKSNAAVRGIQQAAGAAAKNRDLIQPAGCLAHGINDVVEVIAVGSEGKITDYAVTRRDDLDCTVNRYLANPETELAVLIGNIRQVAGIRRDASLGDVAGGGEACDGRILKCGGGHSGMEGTSPGQECQQSHNQDDSSDERE